MKCNYKQGDYVKFLDRQSLSEILRKEYHTNTYIQTILKLADKEFRILDIVNNRYLILDDLHNKRNWYYRKYECFPFQIKLSYVIPIKDFNDNVVTLHGSDVYVY